MQPSLSIIDIGKENDHQPITDFAAARNAALKKATTDWVLFLDSDEVISEGELAKLKAIIAETKAAGLYLRRSDIFYGKRLHYGEWGSTKILRGMQRTKARYKGVVHEVSIISGETEQTDIVILHHAHTSITQFLSKIFYYSELAANEKKVSLARTSFEIVLYPIAKFVLNYVIRLGFFDGWRGLTYATMMTLHSFFVRAFRIAKHLQHEAT
ncbi:MAG: glycosyltransferase family 2 protein [bacterium]|nr:glycosyltransferase family 2 protein [bacterium]